MATADSKYFTLKGVDYITSDYLKETVDGVDKYVCDLCGRKVSSPRGLRKHIKRVHKKKVARVDGIYVDRLLNLEKLYVCDKGDGYKSKSKRAMYQHMQDKHVNTSSRSTFLKAHKNGLYVCDECEKSYTTTRGLKCHWIARHNMQKVENKERRGANLLYSTMDPDTLTYSCKKCTYTDQDRLKMYMHYRSNHKEDFPHFNCTKSTTDLSRKYVCKYCGHATNTCKSIERHYYRTHSPKKDIYRKNDKERSRLYLQDEGHRLRNTNCCKALRKKQIKSNRTWLCWVCGNQFKFKAGLNNHMRGYHPQTATEKQNAIKRHGIKAFHLKDMNKNPDVNEVVDAMRKRDEYVNNRKKHGVYLVAVVSDEAKELGLYNWLKKYEHNSSATAQIYVGISVNGRPSHYHTDETRCHNSAIMKAMQPGSNKCAFFIRRLIFKNEEGMTCHDQAKIVEAQYQMLLHSYERVAEQPNRMLWTSLNQRVETPNMTQKQKMAALMLGSFKIPLVMTDESILKDLDSFADEVSEEECRMDDFAFGEPFYRLLKEDDDIKEMKYVQPHLRFAKKTRILDPSEY